MLGLIIKMEDEAKVRQEQIRAFLETSGQARFQTRDLQDIVPEAPAGVPGRVLDSSDFDTD